MYTSLICLCAYLNTVLIRITIDHFIGCVFLYYIQVTTSIHFYIWVFLDFCCWFELVGGRPHEKVGGEIAQLVKALW